jgi:uncharacterized protein DUF4224
MSESLFLTGAELQELTGFTQPAAQLRWLRKWKIRHFVNAHGRPVVTRAAVEGLPGARDRPTTQPNWDALPPSRPPLRLVKR